MTRAPWVHVTQVLIPPRERCWSCDENRSATEVGLCLGCRDRLRDNTAA